MTRYSVQLREYLSSAKTLGKNIGNNINKSLKQ